MLKYLADLDSIYGPFRVFDSITFRAALALMVSFIFTLVTGSKFIRALSHFRVTEDVSKPDSTVLNALHSHKANVPTMGGIIIVMAMLFSTVLCADPRNHYVVMALFTMLSFAGLGLWDDYVKLRRLGKSRGLSKRAKFAGQIALSLFLGYAYLHLADPAFLTKILLPGTKMSGPEGFFPDIGKVCYLAFFVVVIVGASNAVNLTDGLDGLASGCSAMVALAFTVLAYVVGHAEASQYLNIPHVHFSGELSVFCASMVGATLGFLWFNANPARVFMGDTGSLSLGAAIGFVALAIKQEAILFIAGGIFVLEAMSVILQVSWFKLTGGRLFRCAPFHHHLEFRGWQENHVVVRLWCLGAVLVALALASLKMH